ncbi:MAG TPA: hypothetical protein PKA88_11870, partial [Polyangiaceae bacterium]|nr:hypothetical protein [Polyangiaceae bacterium]
MPDFLVPQPPEDKGAVPFSFSSPCPKIAILAALRQLPIRCVAAHRRRLGQLALVVGLVLCAGAGAAGCEARTIPEPRALQSNSGE